MAAIAAPTVPLSQDTLITIKISVNDNLRKIKLPLRDLGANVLPDKLRQLLGLKPDQIVVFERFSDSAGGYVKLDPDSPQVFKTLMRAAKAKLKLRLRATVSPVAPPEPAEQPIAAEELPNKSLLPVIVHSTPLAAVEIVPAPEVRNIGNGIFQYREARASASQQTLVDTSEAPAPESSPAKPSNATLNDLVHMLKSEPQPLPIRNRQPTTTLNSNGSAWSVYCNECDAAMADAHFHCNICDRGDYDLCESCVANGKLCPGEGHWLIKRFIKDGKVINSITERVSPRKSLSLEVEVDKFVPGAFDEEAKTLTYLPIPTRTCNSCVDVRAEHEFVSCTSCDDFDLCLACHTANEHGHHPAHGFKPSTDATVLSLDAQSLLAAGRNARHNAICDGCDKKIYGVRHKCLTCPDWDFCSECVKSADHIHPRHRFAALYEPIADVHSLPIRHYGIFCDGPLCKNKDNQAYITGVRYKCAVCHDTDFCASCEAFPSNAHNRTHPLIKFKTPVRGVSITTENEDLDGSVRKLGDRFVRFPSAARSVSTETTPAQPLMQELTTVAEIKPSVTAEPATTEEAKYVSSPNTPASFSAEFVEDTVTDGQVMVPNTLFTQVWTMRNTGPNAWPAGCSVRFVGGDNMLNIDNRRPSSVSDITNAKESNVIGRDVAVGESVAFKVLLKAPTRLGRCISYWRLQSADGTPFGHRLWCDIDVQKLLPASSFPLPFPDAAAELRRLRQLEQHKKQLMAHQQSLMLQQYMRQERANKQPFLPPPPYLPAAAAGSASAPCPPAYPLLWPAQTCVPRVPTDCLPKEDERTRKESARQRVEHIKAKILRAREERAKMLEHVRLTSSPVAAANVLAVDSFVPATLDKPTEEVKAVQEDVAVAAPAMEESEEAAEKEEEEDEDLQGSQMVFPKLEKESPASSTYQSFPVLPNKGKAAYVENEQGEVERSASPSAVPKSVAPVEVASPVAEGHFNGFDDLDDLEVLSADDEESEDDGFVTDEEYDILDASDQETVASM